MLLFAIYLPALDKRGRLSLRFPIDVVPFCPS